MKKNKVLPPGVRERNGRYTYRYSVEKIIDGVKVRKQKETPSFATSQAAYDAGAIIRSQQLQGTYVDEDKINFSDWADRWIEIYEASEKKPHSVYTRKSALNRLKKTFGADRLKDIKALQYQEFLYDLKKEGLKKNTLLSIHSTASLVFKKAHRPPYSLISRDITKDVDVPVYAKTLEEVENSEISCKYLEKEQLAHFLKTAWEIAEAETEARYRLIHRQYARALQIMAFSGIRIGELCALESSRVDEVNRRIKITRTLNVTNGVVNYKLDTPKNESSIRDVDITKQVINWFGEQERERKQMKLMCSDFYDGREFIFINAHRRPGYPMNPRDIETFMKKVLEKCGLPLTLSPHSLRHTYTSLMAEAGVELVEIQRQLGHSSDKTTQLVYLHVTQSRRKAAVDKLDVLMNSF